MQPKTKTFDQLVSENKEELLQSDEQWEKLEKRLKRKQQAS